MKTYKVKVGTKGGPGSGNYGHAGRPGAVGGSTTGGRSIAQIHAGLGTRTVSADAASLEKHVPRQMAGDIASTASRLGITSVNYHVVPEGYVVTKAGEEGEVSSYRSIRRITRSTEMAAANTATLRKVTDPELASALGKPNDLMIDTTSGKVAVLGRSVARAAGAGAGGAVRGALGGAVSGGVEGAIEHLVGSIRKGELLPAAGASIAASKLGKKPTLTPEMRKILGETAGVARSHAAAGALLGSYAGAKLGARVGAGSASIVKHPYILKELSRSGRLSVGQGKWAVLIHKTADKWAMDIYGAE